MTFEKHLITKFTNWLTPNELEAAFWTASDDLEACRDWYATQHANRPAGKLRDEILPISIFANFINGHPKAFGHALKIRCNTLDNAIKTGEQYDAKFKWTNFQPKYPANLKSLFVEVTRCALDVNKERQNDKLLSEGTFPDKDAHDSFLSDEYKALILNRVSTKSKKQYPCNTVLVLHLDDEDQSTNAAYWIAGDADLIQKLKTAANEKFIAIFLCGMCSGTHLIEMGKLFSNTDLKGENS